MYLQRDDIQLSRLSQDDLELVRKWRNHPDIQENMVYREHITSEMQENWFLTVNNNNNFYFTISYKGETIGLVNGKDLDWETNKMETGIFIWSEKYRLTHIPAMSTMIFAEFFVYALNLTPVAKVLRNNERSLKYNKMLGFKTIEDDPDKNFIRLSLDIESLGKIVDKLKKAIGIISESNTIKVVFEKEDFENGLHDIALNRVNGDTILKKETEGDTIAYYFK